MFRRLSIGPLILAAAAFALAVPLGVSALADSFGSGDNVFEIEFVTIGDPRNLADTTGDPNQAGAVDYVYQIGKYEISEQMIDKANAESEADGDPLGISFAVRRGDQKPATSLTWPEVARFVNWLNEEKGAPPAYKFDADGDFQLWFPSDPGYDLANPFRNSRAIYFLPSTDEWYKAAYFDSATQSYFDFATGSDSDPIAVASGTALGTAVFNQTGPADIQLAGGASPSGTVGQSGNVIEWEESAFDLGNDSALESRGVRGGDWTVALTTAGLSSISRGPHDLTSRPLSIGFRVARVPEPSGFLLITFGLLIAFGSTGRRRFGGRCDHLDQA